jgi:HK97 family phage major capsid protein
MPETGIDERLLPEAVSARVIESAIKQSVVLQLATRQPMPAYTEHVPVVTTAPSASWVSAGGRKPLTQVEWSAETLKAEEVAAVTAIPDAYIADTSGSWDVEESAENELAKAIARAFDAAVLFGTNAPASYPTDGIAGIAGAALTGDDALEAIDNALTAIETDGLVANGVASSSAIGSALRKAYREAAALPGHAAASEIYGVPVAVTAPWDSSAPDAFVGDWSNLVVGIREDINFATSNDGVLVDEEGDIQVSAFQDDQTLVRIYARFAVAVATSLKADGSGPSKPFVGASWT